MEVLRAPVSLAAGWSDLHFKGTRSTAKEHIGERLLLISKDSKRPRASMATRLKPGQEFQGEIREGKSAACTGKMAGSWEGELRGKTAPGPADRKEERDSMESNLPR